MVIKKWNGSAWVNEYPLVDVDSIVATGTPSSSTFLRGDGAWATPSGADGNNYLTGVSGSGDGTVTFTRSGLSNLTWNAAHTHSEYLTGNQTITLSGDVSGSGTTSIAVTVADDSHNHIISNVDGLQTALDGKASSSHTHSQYVATAGDTMTGDLTMDHDGESTANDSHGINFTGRFLSTDFVNKLYMDSSANLKFGTNTIFHSGNDGSSSGLHADLLDGQQGSYYLDYNNLTNTPTDSDTVTQIRRDNTGTYRTGNINLMSGSGVTITEVASGSFSFAASGGGVTYSSNALYIKRIWSAAVTTDEYTLRYNAGTASGTSVNTTSTWTSIALGYTPASTDKFMIELSNSTSNSVEKGIAWVGHGTFSSTAGMSVISYDAYETVDSGQLKLAKYFCQYQISGSNMNFRYASKMVY